ncbi:MAG: protein translocase subunit SecF [Chloroflexi bacterium]|nr:protein translocase subunit SecF [Chloroflexota bacterium]
MFDIVGKRLWFFLISAVLILIGVIALGVVGLKPGIEFSSGSLITLSFENRVVHSELRQELARLGYPDAIVQVTSGGNFYVRTASLNEEQKKALEDGLVARFGALSEAEFQSVSPIVAGETAYNAGIAVAVAAIGILLYLAWAFRRMPRPFRYGACAVIALLHDVLVVMGIFAILGALLGWEINLMFVTGVLAIIGYSVNNMVVIFDRIRENLKRGLSPHFDVVVNDSVVDTLSRSLNTTITTLITVVALFLFVGASIQNFVVVLLVGLVVGAYDSICVAPSLLVAWEKRQWGTLKAS